MIGIADKNKTGMINDDPKGFPRRVINDFLLATYHLQPFYDTGFCVS
jgi:hypothetical protein